MARKPRIDFPGSWHHVMNRAVARRTMFESSSDVRRFTDRLEIATERCGIEIHAYAVLQTHFHLLVRSRRGQLSEALHLIQSPYALWFNRTRDRDGPIHRSRFLSIEVDSTRYRRFLVRYIDTNPVDAGLAARPERYPHCSAFHFAHREGPSWLFRDWVEAEVRRVARSTSYEPDVYPRAFPPTITEEQRSFVDASPERTREIARHADQLLTQTLKGWSRWIAERVENADGIRKLETTVPLAAVDGFMAAIEIEDEPRHGNSKQTRKVQLHAALGKLAAGATMDELGPSLRMAPRSAHRVWQRARQRIADEPEFATQLAGLTEGVVQTFLADV